MSEENQAIDPILQENLGDVSPNEPLLPKDKYAVEIVKLEQKRNAKDTGNVLYIEMKLVNDTVSVTGEPVPAGRRVFHRISLTPTADYPPSSIQRNLKRFQNCFVVDAKQPMFPLDAWAGLTGIITIGMSKVTDDYPEARNEVKGFEAKK